jgi:hypothetical protein
MIYHHRSLAKKRFEREMPLPLEAAARPPGAGQSP